MYMQCITNCPWRPDLGLIMKGYPKKLGHQRAKYFSNGLFCQKCGEYYRKCTFWIFKGIIFDQFKNNIYIYMNIIYSLFLIQMVTR